MPNQTSIMENKFKLRTAAKTNSNRLHIIPNIEGWSIKREGAVKAFKTFETKKEAISQAEMLDNFTSIIVHTKDGFIQKLNK